VSVFAHPDFDDHEHVSFFADRSAGLRAIVAIHRTGPLGTAGGGCRLWPYRDDAAALRDALRLSRAMTWKLALHELPAGGAKAVVIGDARDKSEALLEALGRAIDRLCGRFVAGEDVGIHARDLQVIARATPWVQRGGGEGAAATAYGVLVGMRAALRRRGRDSLRGASVAVQGLGAVGRALCGELHRAGARLVVTDLDERLVEEAVHTLGAHALAPEAIVGAKVDVFAPCALGDAIDGDTLPRLRCQVVAGSANNPLAAPELADALAARGILYAPDFVINSGGVVSAASGSAPPSRVRERVESIAALLDFVFDRAEREHVSTHVAAERTARERFAALMGGT
jgi:leucine dehydrogenase